MYICSLITFSNIYDLSKTRFEIIKGLFPWKFEVMKKSSDLTYLYTYGLYLITKQPLFSEIGKRWVAMRVLDAEKNKKNIVTDFDIFMLISNAKEFQNNFFKYIYRLLDLLNFQEAKMLATNRRCATIRMVCQHRMVKKSFILKKL